MNVIVQVYKKVDREQAENYRDISLLYNSYKIYAEVIKRRLEKEIERLELLPESQVGFRKERGTTVNIFILNHLTQREKKSGEGKVYAVFVDLKAAFDNVDKGKLWEDLEMKGINQGLVKRIRRMYEGTRTSVRTEEGISMAFETKKGIKQGCVMNSSLFNLYIADLDSCLRERRIGGLRIGKERIWSLAK